MPAKIVIVDDEPDVEVMMRQQFRRHMREKRYELFFAQNGRQALDILEKERDIDLVMTDINMPIMDGLTLLNNILALGRPALRTLIVSAYGDMENIRTAMNRGAFDFLMKPIDLGDLELTINKTLDDVTQLKNALEARTRLVQMQHELQFASQIQRMLLRDLESLFTGKGNLEVIAHMTPARSVGGDFYDAFHLDEDHVGIVIGDVTGKGMPAALFMAVCITTFRTVAGNYTAPEMCVGRINNLLTRDSSPEMFVTAFYGILNIRNGEFVYANGGHNPPYLVHADGSIAPLASTGGILLGMFEDHVFKSITIHMQPGERVFLYTDGVTEAVNARDEMFEDERLEEALLRHAQQPASEQMSGVLESIKTFTLGAEQSDDITSMIFEYKGPAA
jgi:phosphoserine phosphatase RsbU/P